jgi:predicted carbohydrate-binding protein with CBM5 and CBM33 domain
MNVRRFRAPMRRRALTVVLALTAMMGITVLTANSALAHGAATSPGSRTYLCYQDGLLAGGDLKPGNPECATAVATGGTQPLYDWFAVLRSDGAGRTRGFIPDGQLCGGGTTKYHPYDTPGVDWPATRLTSGADWTFHYNAWAAHPGEFRLYITKDTYDPTKALTWDDLEDTPFSTWDETVPNGTGEYYWNVKLPANKTGRHIIYSVWQRSDSTETFYGCSDVVFDGGSGQVIGIPGYSGQPTATPTASTTATTSATTSPTTGSTATAGPTATSTTGPTTTTAAPSGSAGCTAQVGVNAWSGGYQGDVTVLNNGTALTPWTVTFTVPAGVTLNSGWNADVTQSGTTITAVAPSWNRTIGAGAQVDIGFVANGPATPAPSNVKLNGVACGGSGGTTTPTTTTAPPTTAPPTTAPPTTATVPPTTVPPTTAMPTGMDMGCTDETASLICDGFEGQTAGAAPTAHWSLVYPDCQGTGTAVIDTSVAHSGSASLRVNGGVGYCNHVFVQSEHRLDTGGPIYVRAYIRHTTALPVSHVTMIAMTDANDGGKDLRIGGQNSALQWNRSSDDATLPEQSPAGVAQSVALPTGSWQCLEYKIDGTAGTAQTWLNGKEVVGLTADGVATQDVDRQWYSKAWHPLVTNLKLGWESYGDGSDTIWYDDVAAGSSRIGC